jgi:1,4-dihydroxy-6-naphthoate synthase
MSITNVAVREINIAHSPDSDDAFMFYGLATNKIRVPGYKFNHTLTDIETLNQKAIKEAFYDVTAISFHAYPYMQENYALMACGGSVGEGYGPMVVANHKLSLKDLGKVRIAVPGTLTTAYLALKLFAPEVETAVVPFDKIIPAVVAGEFEAGLIIHEGQLTYANDGLIKLILASGGESRLPFHFRLEEMRSVARLATKRCWPRQMLFVTAFSMHWIIAKRRSPMRCSLRGISMQRWRIVL